MGAQQGSLKKEDDGQPPTLGDSTGDNTVFSNSSLAFWKITYAEFVNPKSDDKLQILQSPSFVLSNTVCRFVVQLKTLEKDEVTYTVKLKYLQNKIDLELRSISLSICAIVCGFSTPIKSQSFITNEPQLEITTRDLDVANYYTDSELHFGICINDKESHFAYQIEKAVERLRSRKAARNKTHGEKRAQDTLGSKSTRKLVSDLKEILQSEKDSDVVLKVEDRNFKAHRLILGLRSPVFAAMFDHEMKEKSSGMATIRDCDRETFSDFLHYIYTGTVENLTENAPQLYQAADKYQLAELKEECLEYMKNNISVENFCDVMTISLQHQEKDLTKIATEFFLRNAAEITTTVKWMTFLSENVTVANELFVKLARNQQIIR